MSIWWVKLVTVYIYLVFVQCDGKQSHSDNFSYILYIPAPLEFEVFFFQLKIRKNPGEKFFLPKICTNPGGKFFLHNFSGLSLFLALPHHVIEEVKQSSRAHGWIALQSVYHVSPCEQNIKKNVAGHFSITNDSFCILPTACLYRLLEANLVAIGQLSLNIASRKQNTISLELKLGDRARLCAKRMKNCYSTRRHVTGMHKSGKTIQVGNKKQHNGLR